MAVAKGTGWALSASAGASALRAAKVSGASEVAVGIAVDAVATVAYSAIVANGTGRALGAAAGASAL